VNNSIAGTKQGVDEYQRLTTELEDAKKRSEVAQAKLATCAR